MSAITGLEPEFVTVIPRDLVPGTLYISISYATVQHLCACGCGYQVSTPLSARGWKLIYDGETVSLTPSVGNWSFPCRSHYWIRHNKIGWCRKWTDEEIARNRAQSRRGREPEQTPPATRIRRKPWSRLIKFFRRRR
jgi:hypothetical protein